MVNSSRAYAPAARVLHWGMALLLLALLASGLIQVQRLDSWQPDLLSWHQSLGVLALLALVARIGVRLRNTPPDLPASVGTMARRVAQMSHYLFYLAMAVLPLTGWLMRSASGKTVWFFDMFPLPTLVPEHLLLFSAMRELHMITAWSLIALLHLHVAAALVHAWVHRDGVFQRMG